MPPFQTFFSEILSSFPFLPPFLSSFIHFTSDETTVIVDHLVILEASFSRLSKVHPLHHIIVNNSSIKDPSVHIRFPFSYFPPSRVLSSSLFTFSLSYTLKYIIVSPLSSLTILFNTYSPLIPIFSHYSDNTLSHYSSSISLLFSYYSYYHPY